jgi:predicted transposase YbfD/YdcC
MRIKELQAKLEELRDPRRQWGNLRHKLWEAIIIALCSVMCYGNDYDDMEEFGQEEEKWLKEELGLELKHGIPDGDTFKRIFQKLNPQGFRQVLNESLCYVRKLRDIIPIDGKTKRSSGCKEKGEAPVHIISAFACENQLVLGEIASENHSSEKHENPKLLDAIDVSGDIVTVDAGGCHKDIAEKIIEKEGDYVLTLKGNHPILYETTKKYFESLDLNNLPSVITEEKNGSRLERREYWLLNEIDFLADIPEREKWIGLLGVGMSHSEVEKKGVITEEVRFFITSLTKLEEFAEAVRKHWRIENMHWFLDVIFREDSHKARKDNSAMNMNILEKHALHLIVKSDFSGFKKMGKVSVKRKRLKASRNNDVLKHVILCGE